MGKIQNWENDYCWREASKVSARIILVNALLDMGQFRKLEEDSAAGLWVYVVMPLP